MPGSPSTYRKTKSWTDIWGRAIADTTFDYQGTGVHKISRSEYNRLGQVRKSFRPWQSNESDSATVATKFKYDFLGRVKEIDSPNYQDDSSHTFQNIVTKQYYARDVTTTSWDGKKHKSRVDKYGRLTDTYFDSTGVGWTDHGYTQYFGITSLPTAVYSPAGDAIVYTYDRWRNVRSVTKKDEHTSYSYTDKRGNLRFAMDANSKWSFFEYDSLSRLIRVGTATEIDTTQLETMSYRGANDTTKVTYFYGRYDNPPDTVADTLNGYYGTSGSNYNSVNVIKGMLTQVNDEACKTYFVYDQFGRTLSKIIYFNPVEVWQDAWEYPGVKIVDYKYNEADQIDSLRYPRESSFMTYQYYPSGLLKRVPNYMEIRNDATQPAFSYRAWGAVSRKEDINGLWETFSYDSLSRIQKIAMDGDGGDLAFGESYSYYNQYLTKIYNETQPNSLRSGPRTFYYIYDYRGRVDSTYYFDGQFNSKTKYTYDYANNRRSATRLFRTFYNLYSNSNKLKNLSSSDSDPSIMYTYNNKGNTRYDYSKKRDYRYDYRDMITTVIQKYSQDTTKADTLVFAYNYKNQRVMKLVKYWYRMDPCLISELVGGDELPGTDGNGGGRDTLPQPTWCDLQGVKATFYVWSGDEVIAEYNLSDALIDQYVFANGERVARLHWTGAKKDTTFLHHDRQGSLRMVTWRSGPAPSKMTFDPWGELLAQSGSEGVAYTYTGQEWDEESNMKLFYLRNRYYDPSLGRFLSPDPLVSDLNPYSYCNNNPVMMSDPSGLSGRAYYGGVGAPPPPPGTRDPNPVDTRPLNNGESGPGATDQYGNPLLTELSDPGGSSWLRSVTASGASGSSAITASDRRWYGIKQSRLTILALKNSGNWAKLHPHARAAISLLANDIGDGKLGIELFRYTVGLILAGRVEFGGYPRVTEGGFSIGGTFTTNGKIEVLSGGVISPRGIVGTLIKEVWHSAAFEMNDVVVGETLNIYHPDDSRYKNWGDNWCWLCEYGDFAYELSAEIGGGRYDPSEWDRVDLPLIRQRCESASCGN